MSRLLKIAVADDEPDLREYLQRMLARLGHQVRAAEDGEQLLGLCRHFNPDVIVTDLNMPNLDGLSAAAEVNRTRNVPVILMSATQNLDRLNGSAHGCVTAYLDKPISFADLRAAIDRVAGEPSE